MQLWKYKNPETPIILLLCTVQFVNVLDFMMVMPLGPDFAKALAIPTSHLGWIGGSYTAASAVIGIVASRFLDQYDRKLALCFSVLGLAAATILGAFAVNFETLLGARILAGFFGGPTTSLVLSIATDVSPVERRGRAMGAVFSSFSIASVLGVPAGLELARLGNWKLPFVAVGLLALIINLFAFYKIPSMTKHLEGEKRPVSIKKLLSQSNTWLAFGCVSFAMITGFLIIPNFSAFMQYNLGFPRERLGLLYLLGGISSFILMGLAGRAVDRLGSFWITLLATSVLICVLWFGFHESPPWIPVIAIFVGFMVSMTVRGVATSTLTSKVPAPHERAAFMSLQSSAQNAACAIGSFLSTLILTESATGALENVQTLSLVSIGVCLLIPLCMWTLEKRLQFKTNNVKI